MIDRECARQAFRDAAVYRPRRQPRQRAAAPKFGPTEILRVLTECRWFRALPPDGLQEALREGAVVQVAKSQVLFCAGDLSDDLYVILSGRIAISSTGTSGREIGFREIAATDCFGELAAIDGRPRSANATAQTTTQLLRIPASGFRRLLAHHPTMAAEVQMSLARLVRALSDRIAENGVRAHVRIVAELVRLAEATGCGPDVLRVPIYPAPTDEDLAARLDSQRESVNRVINELKRRGYVTRTRVTMVVVDLPGLRRHLADLRK